MENQEIILAKKRTLLAAKRTFSAWIRTALTAMAGGIAILKLMVFKTELHRIIAHITAEILILWGCLVIVLAAIDYKNMRDELAIKTNYKKSVIGFAIIVCPLLIIAALLIWVTLP